MNVELVIDTRERYIIKHLKGTIEFSVEQLDLGDILFRQGEETVLLIERKTINDLKASICDGRHREQKARLMGCGLARDRICYLIEGDLDRDLTTPFSGFPVSSLVGSLINTQFRDGIKVYKTHSLHESCEYIKKLLDKLTKDGNKYFGSQTQGCSSAQYAATLKRRKGANMTARVWFVSQMCLVPRVTEKVAAKVAETYESMRALCDKYAHMEENDRGGLLENMTYELNTGKSRRIGPVISRRIYEYIYGLVN
jgi:ERCC4-type nuclease